MKNLILVSPVIAMVAFTHVITGLLTNLTWISVAIIIFLAVCLFMFSAICFLVWSAL